MSEYELNDKVIQDVKLSVDSLEKAFVKVATLYKNEVSSEQFDTLLTILDNVEYELVNDAEVLTFQSDN